MKQVSLTPACKLVDLGQESILFGCVAEAIKFAQLNPEAKDTSPIRGIVLPETMIVEGVVNFAPEFPLYQFLFIHRGLATLLDSDFAEENKFMVFGKRTIKVW